MVMQCSMRVVRITVVIDAVEDFEPVLSGVATSYRLRTRREHKDDDMLIQKFCKCVFRTEVGKIQTNWRLRRKSP